MTITLDNAKLVDLSGIERFEGTITADGSLSGGLPVAQDADSTVTPAFSNTDAYGVVTALVQGGGSFGIFAGAETGDTFPRVLIGADGSIYLGDGTLEPSNEGSGIRGFLGGNGHLGIEVLGGPVGPTSIPRLFQSSPYLTIENGALPTLALVSGVAVQPNIDRDVETCTPVTFNPSGGDATCLVELSPDNVTYSELYTLTRATGVGVIDGDILPISVRVPTTWYLRLTVAHAVLGTTTLY